MLVLLLKCLHSLHWSAFGPVHPFWHSKLQAGTGCFVESFGWAGSDVPYAIKYQLLRIPLFWDLPGEKNPTVESDYNLEIQELDQAICTWKFIKLDQVFELFFVRKYLLR